MKVFFSNKIYAFIKLLGTGIIMMFFLRIIVVVIVLISGIIPEQTFLEEFTPDELLIIGLIGAPLIESLFIVGSLLILSKFASRQVATIVTAVLFGIMHLTSGVNWMTVIICALSGYLFIHFYYKAQSRGVSGYWLIVFMHFFDNAIALMPDIIQFFS
jgi:membrane protease YdiL (CAAX protease family)